MLFVVSMSTLANNHPKESRNRVRNNDSVVSLSACDCTPRVAGDDIAPCGMPNVQIRDVSSGKWRVFSRSTKKAGLKGDEETVSTEGLISVSFHYSMLSEESLHYDLDPNLS